MGTAASKACVPEAGPLNSELAATPRSSCQRNLRLSKGLVPLLKGLVQAHSVSQEPSWASAWGLTTKPCGGAVSGLSVLINAAV